MAEIMVIGDGENKKNTTRERNFRLMILMTVLGLIMMVDWSVGHMYLKEKHGNDEIGEGEWEF